MNVQHTLQPFYDRHSKVLILGSMPSVKSREVGFYYAHPKNRFWKVLSLIYQEEIEDDITKKQAFLKEHHIALFDVIQSCEIQGSSDQSIQNVIPNDLHPILEKSQIQAIFTTGKKAYHLYQNYIYPKTKIKAISLPSTSPAYCKKGVLEELVQEYQKIIPYTNDSGK